MKGVRGVDKAESVIVVTLLVAFAVFIVATFTQLDTHLLSPSDYPSARKIISKAAKRRARGYRTNRNYIAMIYLVAGKLNPGPAPV